MYLYYVCALVTISHSSIGRNERHWLKTSLLGLEIQWLKQITYLSKKAAMIPQEPIIMNTPLPCVQWWGFAKGVIEYVMQEREGEVLGGFHRTMQKFLHQSQN